MIGNSTTIQEQRNQLLEQGVKVKYTYQHQGEWLSTTTVISSPIIEPTSPNILNTTTSSTQENPKTEVIEDNPERLEEHSATS
jgi:UDP-N-acetylmuramoylalanine-D-glutamate ligase